MTPHKLSIRIFIIIGILLGGKLGFTLWPATSTTDAAIYTATASETTVTPSIPASGPAEQPTIDQSLAMLEAYIIPRAEAAAPAQAARSGSSSRHDDETLSELRSYKENLDSRAKQLDEREKSLNEADEQVRRRITELEQLETSIKQRLNDEKNIKSKKVKRLTAVFEGMKPEKAAPVIAKMELADVIKVFLLMDEKKVGKILSFIPADKAVVISQALTRQISTVK